MVTPLVTPGISGTHKASVELRHYRTENDLVSVTFI